MVLLHLCQYQSSIPFSEIHRQFRSRNNFKGFVSELRFELSAHVKQCFQWRDDRFVAVMR